MLSMQTNTQDPVLRRLDDAFNAGTLARNDLSIFSRKGAESPEPLLLGARSFSQSMAPLAPLSPRASQRNSPARLKKSKGTILNAVPSRPSTSRGRSKSGGKTVIKASSPLDFACKTASEEATTLQQEQRAHKRAQSGHKRNKVSEDRIGVWVDGIIHWDQAVQTARTPSIEQTTTTSPARRRAQSDVSVRSTKPSLAVIIPGDTSLLDDKRIAALTRPSEPSQRRKHHSAEATHNVSPISAVKTGPRSIHGSLEKKKKPAMTPISAANTDVSPEMREDPSRSSSNASSSQTNQEGSVYSIRSSATSVEAQPTLRTPQSRHKLSASAAFSITNPTVARVLDELTPTTKAYANKPLPPIPPIAEAMRKHPVLPTMEAANLNFPTPPRSTKSVSSKKKSQSLRKSSTLRKMRSGTKLDEFDEEFMKTSPYNPAADYSASEQSSPTLSEAEDDLQESLGRLSQHISKLDVPVGDNPPVPEVDTGLRILNIEMPVSSQLIDATTESKRNSVALVMQPPSRAPTIPKKSRRRDWRKSTSTELNATEAAAVVPTRRLSDSMTPVNDAPPSDWFTRPQLNRSASSPALAKLYQRSELSLRDARLDLPSMSRFALDDGLIVVEGPIIMRPQKFKSVKQAPSQQAAENVLLRILATMTSIDDLINTVQINKGMYRVYIENQLRLLKTVCYNQSPPAWELREWCPPRRAAPNGTANQTDDDDVSFVEHTPSSYMRSLKRDTCVVDQLKEVIVAECSSFIRKETTASMADRAHPQAQRITDAIWRIWTFCTIFGSQKGRDEDLTGQLDWLKGGGMANNLDCAATVNVQFDFDGTSILLNAPEHFGQGNGDGLTADQLYDITEIWTCMAVLLQGYLGNVELAREYGVYDSCNINADDLEAEEYMLEEWMTWILTLGPVAVLEMAQYASSDPVKGFALARERGWNKWAPPIHTTSRVTFLKEPVGRLYEERVTAANAKPHNELERAEKENSRRRIAAHALEIRIRRQDSAFKRVPLIDMTMERPMSILSTLSGGGGGPLTPRFPPKQMLLPPAPPTGVHPAFRPGSSHRPYTPSNLSVAAQMTPPRSSTPDEREALRVFGGMAESTAELAVQRIVAMGFSEAQAKHALKTTDTGDGLRVDRAVDMLLRSTS